MRASVLAIISAAILLTLPAISLAQTDDGRFLIRVQSREVLVPVVVLDKNPRLEQSPIFKGANGWTRSGYYTRGVAGLSSKNFHLFEDGVEQKIVSVTAQEFRSWSVSDNIASHFESSCTPRGIWGSVDEQGVPDIDNYDFPFYVVSYTPPSSPEGSCHNVTVKVDKKETSAFARERYCSILNPPSDPLKGSDTGKQLAEFAASANKGTFPIHAQTIPFAATSDTTRLDIAVDFSSESVGSTRAKSTLALLGMIYDKSGNVVSRFSDNACYLVNVSRSGSSFAAQSYDLPERSYESQIELPPGEYDLKLAVTDGKSFGRLEQSVDLPNFQTSTLNISGLALCRRYHKPLDAQGKKRRPAEFLPLSAKGMEFTPDGNMNFKRGEQLVVFLDVYGAQNEGAASSKFYLEAKATDANTNKLVVDTGLHPMNSTLQPGNSFIPVVWDLDITKLTPGKYRLEIQVSDSSGKKTPWRATTFSVE